MDFELATLPRGRHSSGEAQSAKGTAIQHKIWKHTADHSKIRKVESRDDALAVSNASDSHRFRTGLWPAKNSKGLFHNRYARRAFQ